MTIKTTFLSTCCMASMVFSACNNEIGESKDVNQETIYQQYRIQFNAAGSENSVEVWAQFRFAGENGTTLVLSKPSGVAFDGQPMAVDSSTGEGAYYRLRLPASNFFTKHGFSFTDFNGKKYDNRFPFTRFKLAEVPLIAAKDQPLKLAFDIAPLVGDDFIEVSSTGTDSSFSIFLQPEDANPLIIPATDLKRQKTDELTLEIKQYRSVSLQQSTKEGGKILLMQSLKPVKIKLLETNTIAKWNP